MWSCLGSYPKMSPDFPISKITGNDAQKKSLSTILENYNSERERLLQRFKEHPITCEELEADIERVESFPTVGESFRQMRGFEISGERRGLGSDYFLNTLSDALNGIATVQFVAM